MKKKIRIKQKKRNTHKREKKQHKMNERNEKYIFLLSVIGSTKGLFLIRRQRKLTTSGP